MPDSKQSSGLLTMSDGIELAWRDRVTSQPIGQVVLVHGLGEHQGRYEEVVDALSKANFNVRTFDHRGHGQSGGKIGHSPSIARLVDDLDAMRMDASDTFPATKQIIYGHSFGGMIALSYLIRRQPEVAAAVITSPMLIPTQTIPLWKYYLGKGVARLVPTTTFSIGVNSRQLSDDEDRIERHRLDAVCHGRVSARLARDMLAEGEWLIDQASKLPAPVLLMHGDNDPVTRVDASAKFAESAPALVEYQEWPDLLHELHQTTHREAILNRITEWCSQRVA